MDFRRVPINRLLGQQGQFPSHMMGGGIGPSRPPEDLTAILTTIINQCSSLGAGWAYLLSTSPDCPPPLNRQL